MLLNTPVETLIGRDGRLFFTREGAERTHVVSRVGAEENVIAILPTGSYRFIESRLPYLLLFEEGRGRIVLIDADNHDQPILLQTEALEAHWSPNGETRLLYTNGFETHLFYPQTLGDTLIDRMSRSVASVAWHPSGTAIVLAHQDGVVAYDLHEPGFIQTKLNDAQAVSCSSEPWMACTACISRRFARVPLSNSPRSRDSVPISAEKRMEKQRRCCGQEWS